MPFTLLPAVDVAGGQAVRLVNGDTGTQTVFGAPMEAALAWQSGGAGWIHLVDLDAAFARGNNSDLLASVIGELDVKVQLSAGICDDAALKWALSTGCDRVILSTNALKDPAWCARTIRAHSDRIAIGLDVHITEDPDASTQYRLIARGWAHNVGDLWDTIAFLDREGCARYVVTDVSKDGMLKGPNLALYRAVARFTPASVIASGGIGAIEDLVCLAKAALEDPNLEGTIVGKALYANRFTLPEALNALRYASPNSRGDSSIADANLVPPPTDVKQGRRRAIT